MTDLPATDEELRALVDGTPTAPVGSYEWCSQMGVAVTDLIKRLSQAEGERDREDKAHGETIDQRDAAEEALSQAFFIVTGRSPEWSNVFGTSDALDEIGETIAVLKQAVAQTLVRAEAAEVQREHFKQAWQAAEALAQSHKDRADRLAGAATFVRQVVLYPTNDLMTDSGELNSTASLLIADTLLAALQDDGGAK